MMDARLDAGDDALETVTPAAVVTDTVTVTDRESQVSVSGELNTGGQCLERNDLPDSPWSDLDCDPPRP